MRKSSKLGGYIALIVAAFSGPVAAADPPSKLASGLLALESSDYTQAEQDLKAALREGARGGALLGLSRVELSTGRYAEAVKTAASAESDRAVAADAVAVRAEALTRLGKWNDAIAALEPLRSDPKARRARLLLGQLLHHDRAAPRRRRPAALDHF